MKEINKLLRKFRRSEDLTDLTALELITLTNRFLDDGDFEDSKDTTRELQRRYPYYPVRDDLASVNNALYRLGENLGKIRDKVLEEEEKKIVG